MRGRETNAWKLRTQLLPKLGGAERRESCHHKQSKGMDPGARGEKEISKTPKGGKKKQTDK